MAFVDPDEGILLQGAVRILHGQLPYRDFFSFFTPGSYYWYAFLFKLFGDSILVARTVLVVYGTLFSLFTYILARRLASTTASFAVAILLLVSCMPVRFAVLHNWDSTLAALLAFYCVILFLESPRKWPAAWAGFFTALTMLSNQARGSGLLFGLLLGVLLLRWRLGRRDLKATHFAWMGAGLLLPLVLTAIFFGLRGGLHSMVDCLLWPLHHYTRANWLPYGYVTMSSTSWAELFHSASLTHQFFYYFAFSPVVLICGLPVCVPLVAAACAFFPRLDLAPRHVSMVVMCGSVVCGVLLAAAATRADFIHVTFVAPLFFFALPWVFQRWAAPFHSLHKFSRFLLAYVWAAGIVYAFVLLGNATRSHVPLETRRGKVRTVQPIETVPFIQSNFAPGSSLLVHPYLPLYSFLTRTHSPLRYDYFQPGMHTPEQFQEAVAQLAVLRPPAILLEPDFVQVIPIIWPHTPPAAIHDPVTDYITRNYRMCKVLDTALRDRFWFMVRSDLSCANWKQSG